MSFIYGPVLLISGVKETLLPEHVIASEYKIEKQPGVLPWFSSNVHAQAKKVSLVAEKRYVIKTCPSL